MVILYGHYSRVNFYPEEMDSGNTPLSYFPSKFQTLQFVFRLV